MGDNRPVAMDEAHLEEVERWRAHRLARLQSTDGWLAVVGLAWLRQGENSVGFDPSNAVALPARGVPARVGSIEVRGDRAVMHPDPAAGLIHRGRALTEPLELRGDETGDPTIVRVGTVTFYVIRRLHGLAVRIKDAQAPAIAAFRGIAHYPVDVRWRVRARFDPYEPQRWADVPTVMETPETYRVPGALAFEIDGSAHRLDAFLEGSETDLFVVFGDLTNGSETFGGGRYVHTDPPDERGIVMLDFNRAYNPPCVFTAHATCPLPLPQNRMSIRVEAGEKRYGDGEKL